MKLGYARVSTDGQSVEAQVRQLTKAGCKRVLRETASGAKTDRTQLRQAVDQLEASDVLMVTRPAQPGTCLTPSPRLPSARPASGRLVTHGRTPRVHTDGLC